MPYEKKPLLKLYKPRAPFRVWPPGAKPYHARIHSWSTTAGVGFIDHRPKGKPTETIIVKHAALGGSTSRTETLDGFWVEYYENGIEDDTDYKPKPGVVKMRTLRQGSHRLITAPAAIARLDAAEARQT